MLHTALDWQRGGVRRQMREDGLAARGGGKADERTAAVVDINASGLHPATGFYRAFPALIPGAIVDGILIRGARHHHVPFGGPAVCIVEPFACVGLWGSVEEARDT